MPPWMIGRSMPKSSVMRVFMWASQGAVLEPSLSETREAKRLRDERRLFGALDFDGDLALDQDLARPAIHYLGQHEAAADAAAGSYRRHHPHAVEAVVHRHLGSGEP